MIRGSIIQSNYIPWKGYFDIIRSVDLFIFHDDLQYTKGDWRNRNKIKTPQGAAWLTIPCGTDEKRLICEVQLKDHSWQKKHWKLIQQHYAKAPYFREYKAFFEDLYLGINWLSLSEMNQVFIKKIAVELLDINTQFVDSRDFGVTTTKAERVRDLLIKAGIDHYVSGPSAKDYLAEHFLSEKGISMEWMDYSGYPEYHQLYPPFDHNVSILDLIFNEGKNAVNYMKKFSWNK